MLSASRAKLILLVDSAISSLILVAVVLMLFLWGISMFIKLPIFLFVLALVIRWLCSGFLVETFPPGKYLESNGEIVKFDASRIFWKFDSRERPYMVHS